MHYTSGAGARICYQTIGPADGAPLLLIQGLSAQMTGWPDELCGKLAERGMRVIRFDNRDVGLSEKFGGPGDLDGGYTLADMAQDGLRVLDALDLPAAHVVGQSMGGMIAQCMADAWPQRVRSLSLMCTAPGLEQRHFGQPVAPVGSAPAPPRLAREQAIDAHLMQEQMIASPGYAFDAAQARKLGALAFDRCYAPEGSVRQWNAIMRAPASFAALERLTMPVSVIHGRDDIVVKAAAGIELCARISQAELHLYAGMGHAMPGPLWDEFANIIARTVQRAQR